MDDPSETLVTILVPTYNRASLVTESVRSALDQSYRSIEVVVLDDASPDDTAAALEPYQVDRRFRYVRHPRNLGIAENWRYGITHARGEFFCLLHDDDTLEPEFVRTLLTPLKDATQLALSFCDHYRTDASGQRLPEKADRIPYGRDLLPEGPLADFARAVLVEYSLPVGATLFRRAAVSPDFIDERAKGAIDYWLFFRVLQGGLGAYYVKERLMNYREHSGGMSTRNSIAHSLAMGEGHLFRLETILADEQYQALHREVRKNWMISVNVYSADLIAIGRRAEARRGLLRLLRTQWNLRALCSLGLAAAGWVGTFIIRRIRK